MSSLSNEIINTKLRFKIMESSLHLRSYLWVLYLYYDIIIIEYLKWSTTSEGMIPGCSRLWKLTDTCKSLHLNNHTRYTLLNMPLIYTYYGNCQRIHNMSNIAAAALLRIWKIQTKSLIARQTFPSFCFCATCLSFHVMTVWNHRYTMATTKKRRAPM